MCDPDGSYVSTHLSPAFKTGTILIVLAATRAKTAEFCQHGEIKETEERVGEACEWGGIDTWQFAGRAVWQCGYRVETCTTALRRTVLLSGCWLGGYVDIR